MTKYTGKKYSVEIATGTENVDGQEAYAGQLIIADEFRTRIEPGNYLCVTDATIYLCQGTGYSRREIEYQDLKVGTPVVIPDTVNGHWYGLDPNGDFLNGYEPAELRPVAV